MVDIFENIINPTWVQGGEIGALFIALFAMVFFFYRYMGETKKDKENYTAQSSEDKKMLAKVVADVMVNSKLREEKLMEFVMGMQPTLDNMLDTQQNMLDTQKKILGRLGEVEEKLEVDRRKAKWQK